MESVSVRELRQHLSRYLRRVEKGEHLLVTERRRPVAVLGPLPEDVDVIDLLIATGEISPAAGDLLDLRLGAETSGRSTSELWDELRADRV